jgi:hypothetical protein
MHSIPDVANTASIGTVPSLKVGGMCKPVHCKHCLVYNKSRSDKRLAMRPEYTFSLKSPSNMMSKSVCFQMTSWEINRKISYVLGANCPEPQNIVHVVLAPWSLQKQMNSNLKVGRP